MLYKVAVQSETGQPIAAATVSYIDADGYNVQAAPTDGTGVNNFDDSDNQVGAGYTIAVSADGYQGNTVKVVPGTSFYTVALAFKPSFNMGAAIIGGLGIGAILYGVYGQNRGKHIGAAEGETTKMDYAKYIIPIGIVGVGYFLVKSITNTLGLTETADQKAQREASQNALTQTANSVYATQTPTRSDAEWSAAADQIYSDLSSPLPLFNINNADDVAAILGGAQNTADVLKIIQYFGSRSQTLFGIPGPAMTLPQFIRSASHSLSTDQIATLNAAYTAAGINWQW